MQAASGRGERKHRSSVAGCIPFRAKVALPQEGCKLAVVGVARWFLSRKSCAPTSKFQACCCRRCQSPVRIVGAQLLREKGYPADSVIQVGFGAAGEAFEVEEKDVHLGQS